LIYRLIYRLIDRFNMPVWNTVETSAAATDKVRKEKTYQLYSDVASLYHSYRPRYSEAFLSQAIGISPLLNSKKDARILEIGCGPGAVTLQLLHRGFQVTAMDPGVGMIRQAKEVCKEFSTVEAFRQTTFAEFQSEQQYDAIVAASSLHWALAEVNAGDLIQKLHALLKPQGTIILLWNFPFQPDESARDAVADATGEPKPFYFSGDATEMHCQTR
jgi:2-polyprenyl-3-methyl-5-hydroxy-6-metoxy-1,4-benzoquinol methylase